MKIIPKTYPYSINKTILMTNNKSNVRLYAVLMSITAINCLYRLQIINKNAIFDFINIGKIKPAKNNVLWKWLKNAFFKFSFFL